MKKRRLPFLLIFMISILITFNSCAIVNSLLGFNECNYPGCDRECVENCNYCSIHCSSYRVPEDLNSRVGKSIDEQLKQYREDQKKSIKNK